MVASTCHTADPGSTACGGSPQTKVPRTKSTDTTAFVAPTNGRAMTLFDVSLTRITDGRQLDPGHVCILAEGGRNFLLGIKVALNQPAPLLAMWPSIFPLFSSWWHCTCGSGAPVV